MIHSFKLNSHTFITNTPIATFSTFYVIFLQPSAITTKEELIRQVSRNVVCGNWGLKYI